VQLISIIIPTYNAENYLPILLDKLNQQIVKDFELIIIDSSSKDRTVEIAKEYTNKILVIPQSKFDHGGTRAKVSKIAKGDILLFMTQDALPYDKYSIENIIKIFDNKDIGASYGRQISYKDTNLFGKHLREFNYSDKKEIRSLKDKKRLGIKTVQLSNSFSAYRKDILEEVGFFKDNLILGEDVYTGAKIILAGYSLAYIGDAKVYHSHSYTIVEEFKRYFDIGVFHQCENWILEEFGKAEGEGIKYIKSEFGYLLKNGAWFLIPEFFIRNAMKYIGYKLGYKYKQLPIWFIKKVSMHYRWWDKFKRA
jgi:rhamnosyltransferase